MAKHFREDNATTKTAPRRPQAVSHHSAYAEPVRRDDYYFDDEPSAVGGIRAVGRGLFLLLAWAVRLCAFVLFVVVMLNAIPVPSIKYHVAFFTDSVTSYLPWYALGTLSVDTPFGGTFRCDLCLLSIALFVLDWVLCRIRAALA